MFPTSPPFASHLLAPPAGVPVAGDSSDIFTAIQRFGLKLERGTGEVEAIIIDHAEKPTDN
jgi:uncharacterized protein (TIGR03435 family)